MDWNKQEGNVFTTIEHNALLWIKSDSAPLKGWSLWNVPMANEMTMTSSQTYQAS